MAKMHHIIGVFGPPRVGKTSLILRSCGLNPFDLPVRIQSHTTTKGETHYFAYSTNLQSKTRIARASQLMEIFAPYISLTLAAPNAATTIYETSGLGTAEE
jgi:GTPase SAR1 family protein